ncbi:MAG: FG-GAP-like repeat-containing protein [bacterium]
MVFKFKRPALRPALLLLVLAASLWSGAARAQETDYRKALDIISDKLHKQFPYLEGQIVAIKGGDLYLSLGASGKIALGQRLSVFRKGVPFRHPVTGAVLGTLEDEIGVAVVVDVRKKFSIARMTRLTPGKELVPRMNDIVRLSSAKLRVAVMPFINKTKESLSTDVLTRDLASAIVAGGRFDVYDTDRLQVWFLETGIAIDEVLKGRNAIRLRNQIRGDLALESTISAIKGKKIITSRLLSLTTGEERFKSVTITDELPFEQRAPREKALRRGEGGRQVSRANSSFVLDRQGVPGRRGGVSNFVFNGVTFRGVAVADINGNGKNEVLIITTHALIAYEISQGRMREVARYDTGVANEFYWIDAADMNGDGKPEIYINNYRYGTLLSMILEPNGREFNELVKNEGVFFRLIRVRQSDPKNKIPDSEAFVLLGQAQGVDLPLDGPIYRYRWSGKRLVSVAPYILPAKINILGFGLVDLDKDGSFEVVELGEDDLIRIYSRRGKIRYTSSTKYGGALAVITHGQSSQAEDQTADDGDYPTLSIRSRVMVEDVDGDGVVEVLLISNEYAGSRMVPGLGISSGQVVSLLWDGSGLSELWRAKRLSAGVADFAFGDADNDGFQDLVVVSAGSGPFSGTKSNIYIYKLRQ